MFIFYILCKFNIILQIIMIIWNSESYADISYWRLASGIEVDFVIDDFSVAIEAKSTRKIKFDHLKGLRRLKEQIGVSNPRIIICLEPFRRMTDDGILILPYQEFINDLWQGKVFS